MSITSINYDNVSQPSVITISTNDSYATITTPGYLDSQTAAIKSITGSDVFPWNPNAKIFINYSAPVPTQFSRDPVTGTLTEVSSQVRFNVELSIPQTILSGNNDLLNFDTKVFDNANNFNTSTSLFTAPFSAFYSVSAQTIMTTPSPVTSNGVDLVFIKNEEFLLLSGTNSFLATLPGPLYVGIIVCNGLIQLNEGDMLGCYCLNASDVDVTTYIPTGIINFWTCFSLSV